MSEKGSMAFWWLTSSPQHSLSVRVSFRKETSGRYTVTSPYGDGLLLASHREAPLRMPWACLLIQALSVLFGP